MTSLIAAGGSGRSTSVIPAVPAASSVTTIAFIRHLPVSSSRPSSNDTPEIPRGRREAARRAPVGEVGGERVGDVAQRGTDRRELGGHAFGGRFLDQRAEPCRVAQALLEQRPCRL